MTLAQGNSPGADQIVVNVPGVAVVTGPARKALESAVLRYGTDLFEEAKRLEMGPRLRAGGAASADAQFTDWMIMQAEDRVRPIRYVPQPRKKWPSVLRLLGGISFAGAGAAFGFASSETTKFMSGDAWIVGGIALLVLAAVLELTSIFAPGGAQ